MGGDAKIWLWHLSSWRKLNLQPLMPILTRRLAKSAMCLRLSTRITCHSNSIRHRRFRNPSRISLRRWAKARFMQSDSTETRLRLYVMRVALLIRENGKTRRASKSGTGIVTAPPLVVPAVAARITNAIGDSLERKRSLPAFSIKFSP